MYCSALAARRAHPKPNFASPPCMGSCQRQLSGPFAIDSASLRHRRESAAARPLRSATRVDRARHRGTEAVGSAAAAAEPRPRRHRHEHPAGIARTGPDIRTSRRGPAWMGMQSAAFPAALGPSPTTPLISLVPTTRADACIVAEERVRGARGWSPTYAVRARAGDLCWRSRIALRTPSANTSTSGHRSGSAVAEMFSCPA
jgi:hypothetical protein